MQKRISFLFVLFLGGMVACSSQNYPPEYPKGVKNSESGTPQQGDELADIRIHTYAPERERDLVVLHVASVSGVPIPGNDWNLQDGQEGETTWLYTNGPWVVNISLQVDSGGQNVYLVIVDHMSAVIRWEGKIDTSGEIVETKFIQGSVPDVPQAVDEDSWIGVLVSNSPDSQFDDYLQMMDQNGTRSGVDSVDDVINEKLRGYRDTGIVIQVWGSLLKDVPDAYGTQIFVTRVEPYSQ